jgi:hypothetical protein
MTTTTRRPPRSQPPRPARTRPEREPARRPAREAVPAAKSTKAGTGAPARRPAPPRTPFLLLICGLMGGALVSLLLLNTVLAEDAFTLTRLQQNNRLLGQQRQALEVELAREESPERLAQRAEALGMQRPTRLAFIDGVTGQVIGGSVRPVPHAAAAAAGAAGVIGVPGAVIPDDGVPATTTPRQAPAGRP